MPPRPLPVLAGAYYGTLTGEYETLPAGNIFCFQSTNTTADESNAAARALTIATELANRYGEFVVPHLDSTYSGSTARVYALQYPLLPAQEFHATNTGGLLGDTHSSTRALLVKHTVARRGRGSQGRSYLAPFNDNSVLAGGRVFSDTVVADVTFAFGEFMSGVLDNYNGIYPSETLKYVQLSRIGTGATYPILSSSAERGVASQRARGRRREIVE